MGLGFRPGRGAKDALRRVDQLLNAGKVWVIDADLKAYFDTIPQEKLMKLLEEHIADGALLELIQKMLQQGVMESGKGWQPTERGTPQGAVVSPLLANIYLNALDHLMARQGRDMVRYADDFVILCDNHQEAQRVLEELRQWTEAAMDGGGGLNAALDQNPHRGCQPERRIRLPGLPLRTGPSLATSEESG
jgi:RNA-directed DNA polymerase